MGGKSLLNLFCGLPVQQWLARNQADVLGPGPISAVWQPEKTDIYQVRHVVLESSTQFCESLTKAHSYCSHSSHRLLAPSPRVFKSRLVEASRIVCSVTKLNG